MDTFPLSFHFLENVNIWMNIKMHASFTYQKRIKQMFFNLPFVNLNTAKGEHPRMGALDVCPFIPVQDVSVEECVEISKKFGQKMAKGQLIS